ncbi:transcriptional repressor [Alicyclobacillaceae bacterium I2511]|nr:transcriptional repressor [Alicyclobacillaceae bacterium I2511]
MQREEFFENLKRRGYRLTGRRKEIVDFLLARADGYITAKELIEYLQKRHPTLSFETVYRNLYTLRDEGFIEESHFGDETHYRIPCFPSHHHHFVCISCGRTYVMDHCPMPAISDIPVGFTILQHRFEVFGLCAQCRQKRDLPDSDTIAGPVPSSLHWN